MSPLTFRNALLPLFLLFGCFPELEVPKSKWETGGDSGDTDIDTDTDADSDADTDTDTGTCPDVDGDGYADTSCGGDDCDDADVTVNPGAAEACTDLVDLNCDGAPTGVDADSDGYAACEDCNDANGGVSPGGVEICFDAVDNDCSGTADGSDSVDATVWYADADADGYGRTDVTDVACNAPTGYTDKNDDCDDTDAAYNPGALEDDCTDPNDYNCDGSTGYSDADGDGTPACEDCDDADATVSPDAAETCNSNDDNCNGNVDEGLEELSYYHDADGDGYGNPGVETSTCETVAPAGYVDNSGDCDDTDGLAYPSAPEDCASTDDLNCDGSAGGDDADGDGYRSCEECDDSRSDISPDAVEMCDSVDNDCDGAIDGSDAADATAWYVDADGDEYGTGSGFYSCEEPSGAYAENGDDCDDGSRWVNPAATEDCDAIDNNCDGEVNEDSVCDTGTPPDTGDTAIVIDTGDTSGGDSGKDTSVVDTGDSGTVVVTFGEGDFGAGVGSCSSSPFIQSDGRSLSAVAYGAECLVYLPTGGSTSGPAYSADYSTGGYVSRTVYTATFTVVATDATADVTFAGDFGGNTPVTVTVAGGSTGALVIPMEATSTNNTLRAWIVGSGPGGMTGYSITY